MSCKCCSRDKKIIAKGLCVRCYNFFYKRKIDFEEGAKNYRDIFIAVDKVNSYNLNLSDVTLLLESVRSGMLLKMPKKFWISNYCERNMILALYSWCFIFNNYDVEYLSIKEFSDKLKESPISYLAFNSTLSYLSDLLKSTILLYRGNLAS